MESTHQMIWNLLGLESDRNPVLISDIYTYSGPPLIRPPLGNGNYGLIRGVPLMRGILNTIIQNLFSKILAS